jgi:hypothetical protein
MPVCVHVQQQGQHWHSIRRERLIRLIIVGILALRVNVTEEPRSRKI